MTLPPDVLLTRARYVAVYPLWIMPPGPEAEDRARLWTIGLAEQICYQHGPSYGNKRADPGRPISKDAIAYVPGLLPWQPPEKLWAFDMLTGAGSGAPQIVTNPDGVDISDQVFVPARAVDHLNGGGSTPVPPEPPVVPPYPSESPDGGWWGQVFDPTIAADYAQAGKTYPDGPSAFRWAARTAYDIAAKGWTKEQSLAFHREEWRAALGLS